MLAQLHGRAKDAVSQRMHTACPSISDDRTAEGPSDVVDRKSLQNFKATKGYPSYCKRENSSSLNAIEFHLESKVTVRSMVTVLLAVLLRFLLLPLMQLSIQSHSNVLYTCLGVLSGANAGRMHNTMHSLKLFICSAEMPSMYHAEKARSVCLRDTA
jgi:hypothetical protein